MRLTCNAMPGRVVRAIATAAAAVLITLPATSQEMPKGAPKGFEDVLTRQNSGGQTSTQNNSSNQASEKQTEAEKNKPKKKDRMFYVMPNFLTVENGSEAAPITWKEKFLMAAKGTFDPYEFAVVGVVAGIRQAENAYPGFGQGMQGYGKRYGAAFADQADGNIMVGALFPTILKTDPRYFQMGKGGFARRFGYALSRIFITRRDSGARLFNIPEIAGNATAIAISNVYYPATDRGFSTGISNWGLQIGIDAVGDELKEFWPDIHRLLSRKKTAPAAQ
jgi:hypothetical protein